MNGQYNAAYREYQQGRMEGRTEDTFETGMPEVTEVAIVRKS